jgi:hypothetical protein
VREDDRQLDRSLKVLREALARTSLALAKSRELLSRLSVSTGDEHVHRDRPGEHACVRGTRGLR